MQIGLYTRMKEILTILEPPFSFSIDVKNLFDV